VQNGTRLTLADLGRIVGMLHPTVEPHSGLLRCRSDVRGGDLELDGLGYVLDVEADPQELTTSNANPPPVFDAWAASISSRATCAPTAPCATS
jgi:hypothetical protein